MAITFYDLYGLEGRRFSPFGWRVRMALAHKGLEGAADVDLVRFTEKQKLAFSGQALVPVIVDGAKVITDSWRIACYLEDAYPSAHPLFEGSQGRNAARFVATWVDSQIHPLVARAVVGDLIHVVAPEDQDYYRASREKRFGKSLAEITEDRDETREVLKRTLYPLRKVVEEADFLGGTAANYCDYAIFGAFMWARGASPFKLLTADDPVHAWRERMFDLFDGLPRSEPGYPV